MIVFEEEADIFQSNAQTLVCPVNTVGVMGNGLALAFRLRFPGLLEAYQRACRMDVFVKKGYFLFDYSPDRKIWCFPTKRHWSRPSRLEWIDQGLLAIVNNWQREGINSLAIPAVGCGKGQLDWETVSKIIDERLEPLELKVGVYLPKE